jgi:hypothetical protein
VNLLPLQRRISFALHVPDLNRCRCLLALCALQVIATRAVSAQSAPTHTWGFVTARIDSRFSHYVYTGYGYDAPFIVGALVANPRNGYSEQILGVGSRLPPVLKVTQLAAVTYCNASDSRYAQIYYLPSRTLGRLSASATLEAYLPLDSAGVRQFGITSMQITTRIRGPFTAGIVYELSAAERSPTSQGAGVALRLALPGAELGVDALRGLAHQQDHARMSFRAFY